MVETVKGHVTVEATRKSIKFQQLLATLTVITGIVLLVVANQSPEDPAKEATIVNGTLTLTGGVIWSVFMRLARWWHHA